MAESIATVSIVLATIVFLGALALDHPFITRADLQRWVDRAPPARLFRGRTSRRRAAVVLLFAAAGLALLGSGLEIFGDDNRIWMWFLSTSVFPGGLMLIDISQHSVRRSTEPAAGETPGTTMPGTDQHG